MKPAYFQPITGFPAKPVREHIDKDQLVSDKQKLVLREDPLFNLNDLKKAAHLFNQYGTGKAIEVFEELRTKPPKEVFGSRTGLSDAYLEVLSNEMTSENPKIVPMTAFAGIDTTVLQALRANAITDSCECYLKLNDRSKRRRFAAQNHLKYAELQKAYAMAEIFPAFGITPQLASLLVRCGVGSTSELSNQDPEALFSRLKEEASKAAEPFPYNAKDAKNFVACAIARIFSRGED